MTLTVSKVLILVAVILFAVAFALLALANPGPKVWPELIALGLAFGFAGFLVP
jgi:hypothetical protein